MEIVAIVAQGQLVHLIHHHSFLSVYIFPLSRSYFVLAWWYGRRVAGVWYLCSYCTRLMEHVGISIRLVLLPQGTFQVCRHRRGQEAQGPRCGRVSTWALPVLS